MAQRRPSLFLHLNTEPNPNDNPTLWEHRLRQRRPISTNPFEPENDSGGGYGGSTISSPTAIQDQVFNLDSGQTSDKTSEGSKEVLATRKDSKNQDLEWGAQVPTWLNLFYDLAWTATFSSLTSNNKFRQPWDSISYIVFFTTAWWLWVSQVCYNVDFYTDDWFHLIFIFLQLIIFGALAATTRGFDVSNYILQSPGSQELETYDLATITPERYTAERLTKVSLHVVMFIFAFSRLALLIQHLRVVVYAKLTSKPGRFPRRLLIVPVSLAISAALFFGAFVTTLKPSGLEPQGAKFKYILWGIALLVEVVAHITRFNLEIDQGVYLRSHGSITGRLNDITTIILGEGINAIAGVFYAIEQAPGFKRTTGAGIISCAIIVFFLAYLYFEGAAPLKSVRRRAAWMLMHLPWLLSAILLLEGVKSQLLLSSFFGTVESFLVSFAAGVAEEDESKFNATLRPLLLQSGLTLDQELIKLRNAEQAIAGQNLTEEAYTAAFDTLLSIWGLRVQLSGVMSTYRDVAAPGPYIRHIFEIIEELLHPSLTNARYITGLCGLTFICLATLNLIQSWPRDRFHWASIFSRYAMGICMFLLLLLNVGKYQKYLPLSDEDLANQSVIFKWIDVSWVLPTLAIAYVVQFIVDTALVYAAVWYGKRQIDQDVVQTRSPERKI